MKIGFLITARLKSKRLKFKLLKQLNGYSVIERVIQRAKNIKNCKDIVLCTSDLNQDLPLIRIAKKNNIYYFNGSPNDVLNRLLKAAELFKMDYFLGITADNPLFSIYHAKKISKLIKKNKTLDFVYTNDLPIGANIYAVKTKALKTVCAIKKEQDTEIWGYLINRPEIFNVKKIEVEKKYKFKNYRMTLDQIEDYKFFKKLYNNFPKDGIIDLLEAYKLLKEDSNLSKINQNVLQRDLDNHIKRRINKFYEKNKSKILLLKKKIYVE